MSWVSFRERRQRVDRIAGFDRDIVRWSAPLHTDRPGRIEGQARTRKRAEKPASGSPGGAHPRVVQGIPPIGYPSPDTTSAPSKEPDFLEDDTCTHRGGNGCFHR